MQKILISIKPKYIRLLFSGKKHFEYRKRVPEEVGIALVYATSPIKKIVGELCIDNVLSMSPEELWNHTHLQSGLTKELFFQYFKGVEIAHALSVKKTIEYKNPLSLDMLGIRRAPQSWQYINDKMFLTFSNKEDIYKRVIVKNDEKKSKFTNI